MNFVTAAVRTVMAVRTGAHTRPDAAGAGLEPVVELVERFPEIPAVEGECSLNIGLTNQVTVPARMAGQAPHDRPEEARAGATADKFRYASPAVTCHEKPTTRNKRRQPQYAAGGDAETLPTVDADGVASSGTPYRRPRRRRIPP